MKQLRLVLLAVALVGCAEQREAPPVTLDLLRRAPSHSATEKELNLGRRIFVTRCIECHSLPAVRAHSREAWPGIVAWMAPRAGLSADEGRALVAYLVALDSE